MHFGTIQNNTALKRSSSFSNRTTLFWNHSEQHSSKTKFAKDVGINEFWNHSEQHSSKTSHFKIIALFRNRTIRLS